MVIQREIGEKEEWTNFMVDLSNKHKTKTKKKLLSKVYRLIKSTIPTRLIQPIMLK